MSQIHYTAPVLIVIPCLNEARHLNGLIELLLMDNRTLDIHIVIADGGSTDGTIEMAQNLSDTYENIHYMHNPKRIQSAAINAAVNAFSIGCEYVIRIDAHAEYPKDYCQILIEEAEKMQADSVVVSMETKGKTPFQNAVAAAQNSKLGNGGSAHRNTQSQGMWTQHGHHALMRIKAFNAVGGYDETFSHNEDAELDTRLLKKNYRIWLTARAVITYFPRREAIALFQQYRGYGAGRLRNINKHKTPPKLRQMLPVAVLPAYLLLSLIPLHAIFTIPFLGWAYICLGYGIILTVKSRRLTTLGAGPAAMIMHTAWSLGFWEEWIQHKRKTTS